MGRAYPDEALIASRGDLGMKALVFTILLLTAGGVAALQEVAASRWQWTGIATLDDHTIYVNYPRWSARMEYSVGKLDTPIFMSVCLRSESLVVALAGAGGTARGIRADSSREGRRP